MGTFDQVEVRYAGIESATAGTPAVLIDGGTFTLSNALIRDAFDVGLRSRESKDSVVTLSNVTIRDTGLEAISLGQGGLGAATLP
ncbi:MAG: hypothetical protein ABIL62_01605 [Planctomycetota bacterium]